MRNRINFQNFVTIIQGESRNVTAQIIMNYLLIGESIHIIPLLLFPQEVKNNLKLLIGHQVIQVNKNLGAESIFFEISQVPNEPK